MTGELAVKFFEKSGLNPRILGEVRTASTEYTGVLADLWGARFGELQTQKIEGSSPRWGSVLL